MPSKAASSVSSATAPETSRAFRKVRTGLVVSSRMAKTVVVQVDRLVRHPFYPRMIRSSKKFAAHTVDQTIKVGDVVKIMETRPISKTKRWRVVEIIRHGSTAPAVPRTEADAAESGGLAS